MLDKEPLWECRSVIQARVTAQAREVQVQGQPEHLSLSVSRNEKY